MLKSNFIKPKLNIDFFGKTRFWGGIGLGVGYAFLIYCFFNLLRVGLNFIMVSLGAELLPPTETTFVHFMFAFASCLMGQYVFFEFSLFKNRKLWQSNFFKLKIFHSIRIVCWYTLFVGFDWLTTIKLLGFDSVFALFYSYKIGWTCSIFILVWIHFYVWSLFAVYFKNVFQVGLKIFIAFLFISFLLSKYDPIPSPTFYRTLAEEIPHYKLKIDAPVFEADHFPSKLVQKTLVNTIFVGDPENDEIPNYSSGLGGDFKLEDIDFLIEGFKISVFERKQNLIIYSLVIDKKIKMKNVYQLLNKLSENWQLKIALAGHSFNENQPNIIYQNFDQGLLTRIPLPCEESKKIVEYLKRNPDLTVDFLTELEDDIFPCHGISWLADQSKFENKIQLFENGKITIDNQIISRNDFSKKIAAIVFEKKAAAFFFLDVDLNSNYEDYFWLKNEIKKAYLEVRNEVSLKRFGKKYEFAPRDSQQEIRADFPMNISELMTEEERFIYNFLKK